MEKNLYYSVKKLVLLLFILLAIIAPTWAQKSAKAEVKPYVSRYYYADQDGDGVPDYRDKCVNTPKGEKVTPFGCPPDTDFDGVYDFEDDCDTIKGPRSNKGCPIINLDTDKDGVFDTEDLCPEVPGVKKNRGCPEIREEDKKALKEAFDNLLFETGKDIIKASSFASLNKLSGIMVNNPKYKLHLEGHTDDVGDDNANYILSQNRALAVKKYIAEKGVDENKISAEWYGETKPKATNHTPGGKQLNRRVEMNMIY